MDPKKKKEQQWKEAKLRCKLSDEALRMAREMGLNPLSLIKNIPSPQQRWKAPVEEWVRDMYEERRRKSEARKKRKAAAQAAEEQSEHIRESRENK